MNRATGKLLRACVRLVERDVAELTDAVVQIDEREARNHKRAMDAYAELHERITRIAQLSGRDDL